MDCEYIVVYRTGTKTRDEFKHKFHAESPEAAVDTAKEIIKHHQQEAIQEFPFTRPVVKGELYRQMQELDGAEFIKTSSPRPFATP